MTFGTRTFTPRRIVAKQEAKPSEFRVAIEMFSFVTIFMEEARSSRSS